MAGALHEVAKSFGIPAPSISGAGRRQGRIRALPYLPKKVARRRQAMFLEPDPVKERAAHEVEGLCGREPLEGGGKVRRIRVSVHALWGGGRGC